MTLTWTTPRAIAAAAAALGAAALVASLIVVGRDAAVADAAAYRSTAASIGSVTATASGSGAVQPASTWDVSSVGAVRRGDPSAATTAGAAGMDVTAVAVRVGDRVRAGQVLVRLDRSVLALRRAAAQRELDDAVDARAAIDESVGTITSTSGGGASGGAQGEQAPVAAAASDAARKLAAAAAEQQAPPQGEGEDQPAGDATGGDDAGSGSGAPSEGAGGGGRSASTTTTTTRRSAVAAAREADARIIEARASLEQADTAWRNAVLRAPAAGKVTAVNVHTGARTPSGPVVTIAATATTIDVSLGETDIVGVDVGDAATVSIGAIDAQLDGRVAAIGSASGGGATGSIVTFPVTVAVTGAATGARTGMAADVTIRAGNVADVLTVPSTSVRSVDGEHVVRVLDDAADEHPRDVRIAIGTRGDDSVQVLDGLDEGDLVVVASAAGTAGAQRGGGFGAFPGGAGQARNQ